MGQPRPDTRAFEFPLEDLYDVTDDIHHPCIGVTIPEKQDTLLYALSLPAFKKLVSSDDFVASTKEVPVFAKLNLYMADNCWNTNLIPSMINFCRMKDEENHVCSVDCFCFTCKGIEQLKSAPQLQEFLIGTCLSLVACLQLRDV